MSRAIVAFACGIVFAVGLCLSGMTRPEKVLAFLDVAGAWDPTLALVMASAASVYAVAWRWARRAPHPLAAERFDLPTRTSIDAPLVVGAVVFGVGWGIAGYCPGPSLVSLGVPSLRGAVFVVALVAGMAVAGLRRARSTSQSETSGRHSRPRTDTR